MKCISARSFQPTIFLSHHTFQQPTHNWAFPLSPYGLVCDSALGVLTRENRGNCHNILTDGLAKVTGRAKGGVWTAKQKMRVEQGSGVDENQDIGCGV